MLNNQELIGKLTTDQKLSLLANVSAWQNDWVDGELPFEVATAAAINWQPAKGVFPSYEALANSWNLSLIGEVSEVLAMRAKNVGVSLLEIPQMKPKIVPWAKGLSEDPHLSGAIAATIVESCKGKGLRTMLQDPLLDETDRTYSDDEIAMRTVKEYFRYPFEQAKKKGLFAVATTDVKGEDSYAVANAEWLEKIEGGMNVIYKCLEAEDRISAFLKGKNLSYSDAYETLKTAHERYFDLQANASDSGTFLDEISAGVEAGTILTKEAVDSAVDNVLDFIKSCSDYAAKGSHKPLPPTMLRQAALESIVLLKNESRILPFSRGTRVALIGDLAAVAPYEEATTIKDYAQELAEGGGLNYLGFARGYDIQKDRSDEELEEGLSLAKRADVAVVVLGYDKRLQARACKNGTASLPANQIALVEKLTKEGVNVVAVVCGGYPDMRFDDDCKATLLATSDATYSGEVLWDVLRGKENPSGKLAYTCYDDTDEYFDQLRTYKEEGRNKVGYFYGYRHYDASGIPVKYPFGHGLSYSNFSYSKIKVFGDRIAFKVKNNSRRAGEEVVQLYVGFPSTSATRPKKELKKFVKIHLRPGEERLVYLGKSELDLSVWEEGAGKFIVEQAVYRLYMCASVRDIRATTSFVAGADSVFGKKKDAYSDYLQARSNIHTGGYTLEEQVGTKKAQNTKGVYALIWLILALCVDVVYGYFHLTGWTPKTWYVYLIVGVWTVVPIALTIIFFAQYYVKKNKEQVESMNKKINRRAEYNVDDLADEIPYAELFAEEFLARPLVHEKETKKEVKAVEEDYTRPEVEFDKEVPLSRVSEEFRALASANGLIVEEEGTRKLFASMAASRLVFCKADDRAALAELLTVLGAYVQTPTAKRSLAVQAPVAAEGKEVEKEVEGKKTVFARDEKMDKRTRFLAKDDKIRLLAVWDMKAEEIADLLSPAMRYFDQPEKDTDVCALCDEKEEVKVPLTAESWVFVMPAEGENIISVPKYILDIASVLEIAVRFDAKKKAAMELQKKTAEAQAKLAEEKAAAAKAEGAAEGEAENAPAEEAPKAEVPAEEPVAEVKKSKKKEVVLETVEEVLARSKPLRYAQFEKLIGYACRDNQLKEVLWKRVDNLEEKVQKRKKYRVENKQWQRMERYVSIYLALGGVEEDALDCVVAQQLVYGIAATLSGTTSADEKMTHTLEGVLGDGHATASLKALKSTGLNV